MTREEHLQRIVAKCRELLAIAQKRTPGKWHCPNTRTEVFMSDSRPVAMCWGPDASAHGNAAFIALCAGTAEAGCKATIVAIEGLDEQRKHIESISRFLSLNGQYYNDLNPHREAMLRREKITTDNLIAAWPEELL